MAMRWRPCVLQPANLKALSRNLPCRQSEAPEITQSSGGTALPPCLAARPPQRQVFDRRSTGCLNFHTLANVLLKGDGCLSFQEAEYRCLLRATAGKKKISTTVRPSFECQLCGRLLLGLLAPGKKVSAGHLQVSAREQRRFQASYDTILKVKYATGLTEGHFSQCIRCSWQGSYSANGQCSHNELATFKLRSLCSPQALARALLHASTAWASDDVMDHMHASWETIHVLAKICGSASNGH